MNETKYDLKKIILDNQEYILKHYYIETTDDFLNIMNKSRSILNKHFDQNMIKRMCIKYKYDIQSIHSLLISFLSVRINYEFTNNLKLEDEFLLSYDINDDNPINAGIINFCDENHIYIEVC